jgi:tetratricopeptide (TPR) repeat protein
MYDRNAMNPQVIWFDILFAAGMIERLGYPKIAIEVYQHSMQQPKTKIFASNALDAIQRLKQASSGQSKSTLDGLSKDKWGDIVGFVRGKRPCIGWLCLKEVSSLAQVSREWHQYAQPMIEVANQWRHTDVVPRLLSSTGSHYDRVMLQFLGHKTDVRRFDLLFDVLMDSRIPYVLGNWQQGLAMTIRYGSRDSGLSDTEKYILVCTLSDVIPYDKQRGASSLAHLGAKYNGRAAKLYEKSAQHPKATPDNINWAAEGIAKLGSEYYERAAQLFERAAQYKKAPFIEIWHAAEGLFKRGEIYYPQVANLYEAYALHTDATSDSIINAARRLAELGSEYSERAVQLFKLAAQHPKARHWDIYNVANALYHMKMYSDAGEYYEGAAQHPEARPLDIKNAASGLRLLGVSYYPKAARIYAELAQRPKSIREAAEGFYYMEMYAEALKLYEKIIEDPKTAEKEKEEVRRAIRIVTSKQSAASVA